MTIKKILVASAFFSPLMGECYAAAAVQPKPAAPVAGYKVMSGDDYSLTIGGRVKIDNDYEVDSHQPGGSHHGLDISTLTLKGQNDINFFKKGNFNSTVSGTQLSLDARKKFHGNEYKGYVEVDFNGNANSTTNNYAIRLRHAYFDGCGWLVGQTTSTFVDTASYPTVLNNTHWTALLRQAMIRFTHKFTPEISLAIAAERPNTQTLQYAVSNSNGTLAPATGTGSATTGILDNDSTAGHAKSQAPDGTMKLQYTTKKVHFALRGMVRSLQARAKYRQSGTTGLINSSVDNYKKSKLGWGVAASTRLQIVDMLSIFAEADYGKGIGRYIADFATGGGYDSVFNYRTSTAVSTTFTAALRPLKAWNVWGGVEIKYTDKLVSNFAYSLTKVDAPKIVSNIRNTSAANSIHRKLQKYVGNIIYTLLPNTKVGLEVLHFKRNAGKFKEFKGKDTRIRASLFYTI